MFFSLVELYKLWISALKKLPLQLVGEGALFQYASYYFYL